MSNKKMFAMPTLVDNNGNPMMSEEKKKEMVEKARGEMLDKVKEDLKKEYTKNREYNDNILSVPAYLSNLTFKDNHALVRLYKWEKEMTSKGGIILHESEWHQTAGGQMKSRIDQTPYQKRGVIVALGNILDSSSTFYAKLKRGMTVLLETNKLGKEFDTKPTRQGIELNGFFLVHISRITAIENKSK